MKANGTREAIGVLCLAAAVLAMVGCDGSLSLVLAPPEQCFQQDVVQTGCTTQETIVTYCDDPFGLFCYDELIIEEICGDVIVDSFLVCE